VGSKKGEEGTRRELNERGEKERRVGKAQAQIMGSVTGGLLGRGGKEVKDFSVWEKQGGCERCGSQANVFPLLLGTDRKKKKKRGESEEGELKAPLHGVSVSRPLKTGGRFKRNRVERMPGIGRHERKR